MDTKLETLVLDLVDWVIREERSCEEVMNGWHQCQSRIRTWQEANHRELVTAEFVNGRCMVKPTPLGIMLGELRRENRRQARQPRLIDISGSAFISPHLWDEVQLALSIHGNNLHLLDDE